MTLRAEFVRIAVEEWLKVCSDEQFADAILYGLPNATRLSLLDRAADLQRAADSSAVHS